MTPPNRARAATCRQWIALYYVLAGRRPEAKAVFDELGQYVEAAIGWGYFFKGGEYGYLMSWWWANGVKSIKGLFRMSKTGQDRLTKLLFPDESSSELHKRVLGTMARLATRGDRWLASRAPAT